MQLPIVFVLCGALFAQTNWFETGQELESKGRHAEAIEAFEKAAATSPVRARLRIAANHAALNQMANALAAVEALAANGFSSLAALDAEPRLQSLGSDPRFLKARARIQLNATPCKDPNRPEYRQFDFWIGEWDVFANGSTTQVGRNSIQLILNDCVIYENWTARGGGEGKSFNKYNPVQKQWEQYWVDGSPGRMFFTGQRVGDEMRFTSESVTPAGSALKRKLTFFKNADGTVRQFSEGSTDGGKSYYVEYDFVYKRRP